MSRSKQFRKTNRKAKRQQTQPLQLSKSMELKNSSKLDVLSEHKNILFIKKSVVIVITFLISFMSAFATGIMPCYTQTSVTMQSSLEKESPILKFSILTGVALYRDFGKSFLKIFSYGLASIATFYIGVYVYEKSIDDFPKSKGIINLVIRKNLD